MDKTVKTICNRSLLWILVVLSLNCRNTSNNLFVARCEARSEATTIIRDHYGVPHIFGKTDADAVFGLMYAQCEESFERIERNYIRKFGRMAELNGATYLTEDLKMQLIYDTATAKTNYSNCPPWLKELCLAFSDGINYYLYKNTATKPALLTHFEPWYALMFTDGAYIDTQTGGLTNADIHELYKTGLPQHAAVKQLHGGEMQGSNAFAIAPSKTASHHAMLYINPHVTFDFRMEAHMVSETGLNVYGAVTWGQFFIFQGFNERCGWMHTSSMTDAADLYEEQVSQQKEEYFYTYNGASKKVGTRQHRIKYKEGSQVKEQVVNTFYTHHGPVMGSRKNRWLSLKLASQPLKGLQQSWLRTKSAGFADFKASMQLMGNTSTNTMYADGEGKIVYWHGNLIPKRNAGFDYNLPLDGTNPATEWTGYHTLDEIIQATDPANGWLQNCNSTPFSAAGISTADKSKYPFYMAPEGENFRSLYAMRELEKEHAFTLDKLITLGNSRYLAAFDSILPPLINALDAIPASDSLNASLQEAAAILKGWDKRSAISSVATTIAVLWGYAVLSSGYTASLNIPNDDVAMFTYIARQMPAAKKIDLLSQLIAGLQSNYGSWKIPWGEINRYQRLSGANAMQFDDAKESLPAGATSALFGCLPAYEVSWTGTKGYGIAGNSFVAAVEFGEKVKAWSIVAGGQSFTPGSTHFSDQAQRYLDGKFKEVLFYKEDILKYQERSYHPGE